MKRWVKITLGAVAVIIIGAASYTGYMYHSVKVATEEMYLPRKSVSLPAGTNVSSLSHGGAPATISQQKPFTVLVLGVDQRKNDPGRSDTMLVLTVNPAEGSLLMFNIPRDTRTEIIGRKQEDKINHAFAFGGADLSIRTVEHFLKQPINYYIQINMEGFARIIDLLGGLTVDNPFEFQSAGHTFAKGTLELSGNEALAYARMRFEDPQGDIGRNTRQREMLKQILVQTVQKGGILKLQSILEEAGEQIRTDITFDDMKTFVTKIGPELKHIETTEIKGRGTKINGIYYYLVDADERKRAHRLIEEQMLSVAAR